MSRISAAFFTLLLSLVLAALPAPVAAQTLDALTALVDEAAPDEPLDVEVGVFITQITSVDQKSENFGVVARLRMKWHDPMLAFDAEELGRSVKALAGGDFLARARDHGIRVPVATIENQQSRSFDKTSSVSWFSDGTALYTREMIVTLQAPDFDFRSFPFDNQNFYFRIVANAPSSFVRFRAASEGNGLGDTLGEEEWIVASHWTEVDEVTGITGLPSSRLSLGFSAHRHLLYYWARIFVPMVLLLGIGWANLFLEEYRRRIDIATGNLLAFIAFNFTISGELPRLGYLTFLDSLIMAIFLISAGSVAYNVALRRFALAGYEARTRAVDWHVTWWGYPLLMIVTAVAIRMSFL